MTTEAIEMLRIKAQKAVLKALGGAFDCDCDLMTWDCGAVNRNNCTLMIENPDRVAEITNAALDAVGFDAIMSWINVLLPNADIVETALEEMDVHEQIQNSPKYKVCAELVRLADAYETLMGQHPELETYREA